MNKVEKALKILKRHYGDNSFTVENEPPFRALIGSILSQHTRNENSSNAANALFDVVSTPQEIIALEPEKLKRLIRSSGYYNQKAKHITGACKGIIDNFKGDTPRKREELLTLPGVGPKTADIVLSYGYNEPAIAVDSHIYRTTKRLGLAPANAKPTDVKKVLESTLPRDEWYYAGGALLQLGKDYCKPKKPRCEECPLRDQCENRGP